MKKTLKKHFLTVLQTFLLTVVLCFGAGALPVEAAQDVVSKGNLLYEDERGGACLYAADIRLLEEKLSSIPEQCFDPLCYAHTHTWEYCAINERTHTRHCAACGEKNDLTSAHRAERCEQDTIFYEGKSYPAKRFFCACGYQWQMESAHNLLYEAVDERHHRSRCELDGTPYCSGYEPSVEEHYAWYYEMDADGAHHTKICFDCGYKMEEACCFAEREDGEGLSVCVCGRTAVPGDDTGQPEETEETGEAEESKEPEPGDDTGQPEETEETGEAGESKEPEPGGDTGQPEETEETGEAEESKEPEPGDDTGQPEETEETGEAGESKEPEPGGDTGQPEETEEIGESDAKETVTG